MSPIGFAKAIITTASGAGGGNGSSAGNPAISAKEAYNGGLRGSTAWVSIPGNGSFQFQYDDSDRLALMSMVGLIMIGGSLVTITVKLIGYDMVVLAA